MASQYDQGLHDQHASPYASLPGTSQAGFVTHNMTPMKSNLAPGRELAGCSPSRWIYELINNDFTVCDMFERYRQAKPESRYTWEHPHQLVINGNQSFSTDSSRVLSSICLDCNFHFIFKMTWDEAHSDCLCHPNQSSWPLRDNQFPWHHLVWAGSSSDPDVTQDHCRYYPLLAREHFVCSAPPCTFQLTLEVSEPRMPSSWTSLLLDREAICEQLRIAKEQEPTRYDGATDEWAYQATLNLNTYLKNLLESQPEDARSISKRNKRFAVLFGPRCFPMFRDLGFSEKVDLRDGVDEGSFTPAPPPPAGGPSGATEISTYRSYLEDVRAEVQCLIHKAGQAAERPTFCTPVLQTDLDCEEIPNVAVNGLINAERYKLLGVLPNQSREAVVNAYKRQWELLPSRRRALVDAIMGVANDTGDELLSDYAITQSSVFDNQTRQGGASDDDGLVTQALNFLGLQPPNNHSAESLLQAFRQKVAQDPADASTARSMLLLIAQNSTDDMYQAKILMEADAKMSLETSRFILGLNNAEVPWQTTIEATKKKLSESKSKEATPVYLDAADAIADHTYSAALKQAVMELRQSHGMFGFRDSAPEDSKPVDYALPVGLHNIGNTCYLNSLLQYLFTVKPIRDIVLNYEDVRLDLTEENIRARLLGGNKMQMDRGEAVVAQAFAKELADLFRNLQSSKQAATKPSQRLANAVLLSTHTLLHTPKQSSGSPAGSNPPPLPARPSPAPPTKSTEDVDMANVTVTSIPESTEVASNSSSRTLVDLDDAASDRSFEKVEAALSNVQADGVVEIHADDTAMTEVEQPTSQSAGQTTNPGTEVTAAEGDAATNEAHDIDMADAAESETVDQKVLNALEHQKRSSGTDQQDVEEVMGSIINRLQAAIRPSSIDEKTGIQLEKIMETFFVTTVNYTKKFDDKKYQNEISFDRSITAFPAPDGPCSLYDALGRNFDQQILEESKLSRYTAIKTLPPVLHILIQRTQSMGSKNGNAVVIPETLYLDRYMDAPHDSPIFKRRVEDWAITDRIADVKAQLAKTDASPTYLSYLQNYADGKLEDDTIDAPVNGDAVELVSAPEENWDFDGPVEDDFLIVTPSDSTVSEQITHEPGNLDIRGTHKAIIESMERELHERELALEMHRDGMKEIPYRLHAVICHRGQLMSGHYWVWIHDFEENTWRWYNDADVKENKDTAEVLQTLGTSGEPYYLCYVRDEDKASYVDIPKRQPPTPPAEEEATPPATEMKTDGDGDVDIDAAAEVTPPAAPIEMVEVSKVRSRQNDTESQQSVAMHE